MKPSKLVLTGLAAVALAGLFQSCGKPQAPASRTEATEPPGPGPRRAGPGNAPAPAPGNAAAETGLTLQQFRLTSTVPASVSVAAGTIGREPLYRATDGAWKSLPVTRNGKTQSFTQPADAVPTTLILLDRPKWLQLPDDEPPAVRELSVGGTATAFADIVKLGRLKAAPQSIVFTVADALNPIATTQARIAVDGQDLAAVGGTVAFAPGMDLKQVQVRITPGTLTPDAHTIAISVPDAAPGDNARSFQIQFTTAPIVKNGDFEAVDANGAPRVWSLGRWSEDAATRAELKIVEAGHAGKALLIEGIAGSLNLVCCQNVDLLDAVTYVLSGFYKNTGDLGAASIVGQCQGKQDQYDSMPVLKKADDWTPFAWEFTTKKGNTDFLLVVRSGGVGKVFFDDVKIERKDETPPPAAAAPVPAGAPAPAATPARPAAE